MVEAISMGNETAELLDREATLWKQSYYSPGEGTNEDHSGTHSESERRRPFRKRTLPLKGASNGGTPNGGTTNGTPNGKHYEPSVERSINLATDDRAENPEIQSSKSRSEMNHASDTATSPRPSPSSFLHANKTAERSDHSFQPKRRRVDGPPAKPLDYFTKIYGESIPLLNLDSDLHSKIKENSRDSPERRILYSPSATTTELPAIKLAGNGLNLRLEPMLMEPNTKKSPNEHHKLVGELEAALKAKEQDIIRLKTELENMRSKHKSEVSTLIKNLHQEYSKQASGTLRRLYEQAEVAAQKRAEKTWKSENDELKALVQSERAEKSELVRACDEYLRLNGF